ncbi:superoxide dismutase family protein [Fodinicurvata sp. EGI_FJ10296]|uniref:superoxide dismutase family protein n=1 Tax=Fodinicurvata sp. EGI_FJ10296 TaxID=3231908 RepID=UPI003454CCBD
MKLTLATSIAAIAMAGSAAMAEDQSGDQVENESQSGAQRHAGAGATFVNTDGEESGTATLTGTESGVLIEVEVNGLPSGQWVALHVHENGACNPEDSFDSAGGHFNPTGQDHGYLAANGPHVGDMPNQYVGSDGTMRAEVFNSMARLDAGESDVNGRALVIHGGRDDYESQPSGDAGDRLACAMIE